MYKSTAPELKMENLCLSSTIAAFLWTLGIPCDFSTPEEEQDDYASCPEVAHGDGADACAVRWLRCWPGPACCYTLSHPHRRPAINVETAKKAAEAALAEARKNGWLMVVAVVDPNGTLVYYEKMDNTQLASAEVAIDKARSPALYTRPTKALQDAVAGGAAGLRVLALRGGRAGRGRPANDPGRQTHRGHRPLRRPQRA